MIEKEKQYHWNYYLIVTILFLFIIFLWIFIGGWGKQFKASVNNSRQKRKIDLKTDFENIIKKSNEQFSRMTPSTTVDFDKENFVNNIVDDVLKKVVDFQGAKVRYPEKWVKIDGPSTSTLTLLSTDGERFDFSGLSFGSSTDPISSWHAQKNEPVLNWSWRKVKDGYVGFNRGDNFERIVGLCQVSSSTIITLERSSREIKKAEDGLIEMLIVGLRK